MNIAKLNTVSLDDKTFIKRGTSGGATINNQNKVVDITENGSVDIVPDAGYTGLSKVTINTEVSGGSKYHEIKPNGWYWKTTEELKAKSKEDYAVALNAFLLVSSFYEAFPEKGLVINFAQCYTDVSQLGYGEGFVLDYISEAVPDSMMTGTPTSSLRDFFVAQGVDEATFLAQMESMGFISITEEEYMAARAEKN